MAARPKKYFVLMKSGKDTDIVFHNAQPRGAALKAASRGETDATVCSCKPAWMQHGGHQSE